MLLSVLDLLVCLFACIFFLYRYIANRRRYWADRKVPGPTPSFFKGNLIPFENFNIPVSLQISKWTKIYGSIYGYQEGWNNVIVISDLNDIYEVFVKQFENFYGRKNLPLTVDADRAEDVHVLFARGQRWKRLRALSCQAFTANALKKIYSTIEDSVKHMVEHMSKYADTDIPFNIHNFYQELTMDVIARVAMGQEGSCQFRSEYIDLVKDIFAKLEANPFLSACYIAPFVSLFVKKLAQGTEKFRNASPYVLRKRIERAVEERKAMRESGAITGEASDFIDLFLNAEANVRLTSCGFDKHNVKVEKKLTPMEVVMQCYVFLVAGFDTTANSSAFVSYCLAKHPDVQRKLQEEIDDFCYSEDVIAEQLRQMTYMEMVVKEALRLYPTGALATSRVCMKETKIGNVVIEEGTSVMADVLTVHYNTDIWGDDAHEFRPERWETGERRHQMAFLPFGAGPRLCLGRRLADMEEKLALIYLLKNYDIVECNETEKEVKIRGGLTFVPESVTVKLRSRKL